MSPSTPTPRLTRRGAATRARIVEHASALVFEHGVAGTSIGQVQEAAGVSASQLYHYFEDKQALTRAVVAHQADAVLQAQEPQLHQLDTLAGLRRWRDALVALQEERHCRGGCPIGSLSAELSDVDDAARAEIVDGFARWQEPIEAGLASMLERGDLPRGTDVHRLGNAVLAAVQGGLVLTQARRDPTPLADALDAVIDHVEALSRSTT